MYEQPAKFTLGVAGAIASGTASVISEQTLVPLGVFIGCSAALLLDALDERRLSVAEGIPTGLTLRRESVVTFSGHETDEHIL